MAFNPLAKADTFQFEESVSFIDDFKDFHLVHANEYGTVYRAVECATNRVVAVKSVDCLPQIPGDRFPNRYTSDDETITKDFTILESLRHPHIVEILSVYIGAKGFPTRIVLDYAAGGTLLEYLQDQDPILSGLPEMESRDIMYQLCQAMAYVHRLGIVHCNLKPENILLTGETIPFIKVGGFGLAMRCGNGEKLTDVRGSYQYAAPEITSPARPGYDHRADSWSAGITLFAMMILGSPHGTEQYVPGEPVRLQWDQLRERVSDDGLDLIVWLLCEDPDRRCLLGQALGHRWLMYHRPMYPNIVYP